MQSLELSFHTAVISLADAGVICEHCADAIVDVVKLAHTTHVHEAACAFEIHADTIADAAALFAAVTLDKRGALAHVLAVAPAALASVLAASVEERRCLRVGIHPAIVARCRPRSRSSRSALLLAQRRHGKQAETPRSHADSTHVLAHLDHKRLPRQVREARKCVVNHDNIFPQVGWGPLAACSNRRARCATKESQEIAMQIVQQHGRCHPAEMWCLTRAAMLAQRLRKQYSCRYNMISFQDHGR